MKKLKFRQSLAREILADRKTVTWRLFDDKDLGIGDKIELIEWENKNKFAEAEVIGIKEKKLREIKEEDFDGHEKFASKEEMYETYKKYYGDKVTPDVTVKILKFRLIK